MYVLNSVSVTSVLALLAPCANAIWHDGGGFELQDDQFSIHITPRWPYHWSGALEVYAKASEMDHGPYEWQVVKLDVYCDGQEIDDDFSDADYQHFTIENPAIPHTLKFAPGHFCEDGGFMTPDNDENFDGAHIVYGPNMGIIDVPTEDRKYKEVYAKLAEGPEGDLMKALVEAKKAARCEIDDETAYCWLPSSG